MINIVINYDTSEDMFKVYEESSDTLIITKNLTEALVNLSSFLSTSGMISGDILSSSDIIYHIDSQTMKNMIESNVSLMKRLNSAPSGFLISSQRFGGNTNVNLSRSKSGTSSDFNKGKFGKRSLGFSGKSSFKSSEKKFGNKEKKN